MSMLLALLACQPDGPYTTLIEADPSRDGRDGTHGPYGAALQQLRVQARVVESVDVGVIVPADEGGAALDGDFPVMVFIQGGLVAPERYHWLPAHAATRGYVSVVPHHSLDLAISQVDNGLYALDGVAERTAHVAPGAEAVIAGHSLGGVVSAMQWVDQPRLVGLGLLASYPAEGTPVEERTDALVLSLTGSEDGLALEEDVREGWRRFGGARWLGVLEGMNHYDWTDDATAEELANDGASTVPLDQTRRAAQAVFDAWLDAVLLGDADAREALDSGGFDGVELER